MPRQPGQTCVEAAVDRLLPMFLGRLIRRGSFTVTTAAGKTFGDGHGPPVAVRFIAAKAQRAVILDPEFALGEA
jgi:cyclopropane-fatty-acyl-phospholipid synthase